MKRQGRQDGREIFDELVKNFFFWLLNVCIFRYIYLKKSNMIYSVL